MDSDRDPAEAAADVAAWNTFHPIGTPVRYWPGVRGGSGKIGKTRSPAWVLPSGSAVVMVTGTSGGVALAHVEPISADEAEAAGMDTTRAMVCAPTRPVADADMTNAHHIASGVGLCTPDDA